MAGCLAWPVFDVCGPIVCSTKERLRDSTGSSAYENSERYYSSIPKHVLEADFWIASLRVCPGHNFRSARNSAGTIGSISFGLLLSGAKRLRSKVTLSILGSARPVFSSDKVTGSAARRQQL